MVTLFILLFILGLWILGGLLLFRLRGRGSKARGRPIVRGVDRRICLTGDQVRVTLRCSVAEFPPAAIDVNTTPWDIVLVIDHSASMGSSIGSALDEARKAAINLIATTPGSFRFSVVEFDHEAREICPLTDRRRGLIRSIKTIGAGGATDIALGLETAGKALAATAAEPERKRAVILLSDGGSDRQAALEQAQRLKGHEGLLLITIGLGAANMPLLRELASTPEHCYQADEIDQLTELYGEIGRMISGREATGVEVEEGFDVRGKWGLRGWGELQPSQRSLIAGRFSWLLAVLHEKPPELSYYLEAGCPGWRPIAPKPAKLHAKLADGKEQLVESNRGPWVLVLPRVPGWQLLWLLLNPLFFLIARDHFCRHEVADPLRPKVPPRYPELESPPVLQPPARVDPPLSIRPTLVLGLGYGGMQALLHCKRLLWERDWRADMDRVGFLALDTADETYLPSPRAGAVALDADERLTLDQPLEPVLSAEAGAARPAHPWLAAAMLSAGGTRPDLHRGTGTQRALGRLALLRNLEPLRDRLRPRLRSLLAASAEGRVDVLIAATSGGGTGSGGIWDLSWLCRSLLQELDSRDSAVSLFLLAPQAAESVTPGPEVEALRRANHQALMAELDRFSTLRDQPLAPVPGEEQVRQWFDRVFCVGPSDQSPWPAEQVLYPKAGEMLFAYLASDRPEGINAHFAALDREQNERTLTLGRALVHRVDPDGWFFYPRTVGRYLVLDGLRRTLAQWLWDMDQDTAGEYSARAHRPAKSPGLLQAWLGSRAEDTDFPWVFQAMSVLQDATQLQRTLAMGAGPGISGSVSMLARSQFLDEQRMLVRGVLDAWIVGTLNQGLQTVGVHALAACIHALGELHEKLKDAVGIAWKLEAGSDAQIVRDEAGLVAELASQAAAETEGLLRRLGDWDRVLGEGNEGGGVLRYLDETCGVLHTEIETLRDAADHRQIHRSPRLPLDRTQLEALASRLLDTFADDLAPRLRWELRRDGTDLDLILHTTGAATGRWGPDDLIRSDAGTMRLAESLVQLGIELTRERIEHWGRDDYDPGELPTLRAERPRTGALDGGARAVYLMQGADDFSAAAHVEQVAIAPLDRREARVVSCEENLPSDRVWPPGPMDRALPFVFREEHHAYRAYDLYCRRNNLRGVPLAPTLVGICREPDAVLAFAFRGLAEGALREDDDGMKRRWSLDLGDRRIGLCDAEEDVLKDLIRVANAWMSSDEPALREVRVPDMDSVDDLDRLLARHRLIDDLAGTDGEAWREQLVGVVWGLTRLR